MQRISITNPQNVIDGTAKKYYFKLRNTGGPKGDKGDKGDTGATGPQGPQGNAATVSVGSTTTLPVGYDATVTNSGSIYNAVLDFGIPQGPRGPQGAKGDKGDKGDKGEQGNTGPTGPAGTNATVYIGTTITGNPGTQASVYNSGTDSNAVLNFTIPRGDVGPMPELAQTTGTSTTAAMSQNATTVALNNGLAAKQDKLTAGSNITISGNTISATDTTYTAGNNVQISGTVISATDTTYTAGNGLNLNGTEFSADTDVLATKEDLESYYTKPETDNLLAPKLEAEVVAELPATGTEGKLYLTPKNYTRGTGTGNPIEATITDGAGKMESFKLDGDTFQQSYTGKNLFQLNGSTSEKGLTISRNTTTGAITFDGTTTGTYPWLNNAGASLPAGTYTFSIDHTLPYALYLRFYETSSSYPKTATISAGNTKATVTTTYTTIYFALLYGITSAGAQVPTTTFYPQLESGSSVTSFEPYVGGTPSPNPEYPQPIQTVTGEQTVTVVGKNLAQPLDAYTYSTNGSATITSQANGEVTFTTSSSSVSSGVYIYKTTGNNANLCPELFTAGYTVSFDAVASATCTLEFGVTGNHTTATISTTKQRVSVATATGAGIVFYNNSQNGATITISDIQVELGSTESAYTPYSKQTYPINLGNIELCKLDTYQDYIYKDGDDWKVHKATGKFVFTAETTPNTGRSKNGDIGFVIDTSNNPLPNKHIPLIGACSHFGTENTTTTWTGINNTGMNTSGALWFQTGDNDYPDTRTIAQFFEWLAGSNTTYNYALATPTDTTITDQTLIAQLEAVRTAALSTGSNTISNTATGTNLAGDLEIGYYGYDPTNRYDKWLWLDLNNNYEQIGS